MKPTLAASMHLSAGRSASRARAMVNLCLGVLMVLGSLMTWTGPAHSQQALRIAATVNDEMISIFDVEARMSLAIVLSKLPNTTDTRRRLAPQILRSIIDDKLKMQEAKRMEISVSRGELSDGIRKWETRSGLAKGDFAALARRLQIDKSVIAEQIETGLAWRKVLSARFLPSIQISDKEIDDILREEEGRRGQPAFLVSEIYLPFGGKTNRAQVASLADRLIQQIQGGAPFSAVARNFSQSPTAAVGGNLGWVRRGQLATELDTLLPRLNSDQISAPIRTLDGIYILHLRNKRAIEPFIEKSSAPETVTLYQVHFPLPPQASPADSAAVMERARRIGAQANNCADMERLGKQHGSSLSGSPGKLAINQLSPQLRSVVAGLPELTSSAPVALGEGIIIVMVCERTKPVVRKIDRDTLRKKIRSRLVDERMNLAARQFLTGLRRAAIVDVRI